MSERTTSRRWRQVPGVLLLAAGLPAAALAAPAQSSDRIIVKFRSPVRTGARTLGAASLRPLGDRAGLSLSHHRAMSGCRAG